MKKNKSLTNIITQEAISSLIKERTKNSLFEGFIGDGGVEAENIRVVYGALGEKNTFKSAHNIFNNLLDEIRFCDYMIYLCKNNMVSEISEARSEVYLRMRNRLYILLVHFFHILHVNLVAMSDPSQFDYIIIEFYRNKIKEAFAAEAAYKDK